MADDFETLGANVDEFVLCVFDTAVGRQRSIRRADVVLHFFDAAQKISKVDKQLCEYIAENYKPCVFVVNKWDLMASSMPTEKWVTYLHDTFRTMWYVPMAFITGQTGKNVKALLNHAQMLFKQSRERVSTGELNRVIRGALERSPPPLYKNRLPKIFYATQVGTQPPTIVLFCSDPHGFSEPYRRYLLGVFREKLRFSEVPIKLYLRKRQPGDQRDDLVGAEAGAGGQGHGRGVPEYSWLVLRTPLAQIDASNTPYRLNRPVRRTAPPKAAPSSSKTSTSESRCSCGERREVP
jgi:hypothetical protein